MNFVSAKAGFGFCCYGDLPMGQELSVPSALTNTEGMGWYSREFYSRFIICLKSWVFLAPEPGEKETFYVP